jgi:hypothetical protein
MGMGKGARRVSIVGAAALVASTLGMGAGSPAGAAKTPITAVGEVSCLGSGKAKAVTAGTSTNLKANVKFGCAGTTGDPKVTVTGARGYVSFFSSACSASGVPGSFQVTLKWKAKGGKIAPTTFAVSTDAFPSGWSFPGSSGGSSPVNGSWASASPATGNANGMAASLISGCGQAPRKHIGTLSLGFSL